MITMISILGLLLSGCNRKAASPATPVTPTATHPAASQPDLRIISLSPAISRTLVDFNLQDKVVGRSPHCIALDESIPVVGDLLNVDYEQIIKLQPTHILVQPPEAGVDAHLQEMAKEHHWSLHAWRLNGVDDIETMVRELPAALFTDGSPQFADAARTAADITNRIAAALAPGEKPVFKGRTLLIYSLSPVSVFGKGTYLDDVLTALGGTNATDSQGWISLSMEDLVRLNPDAIILVKPGADGFNVHMALGVVWEQDINAVNNREVAILTNPDSFMPSSGIIGVAQELRSLLERFGAQQQ